MFEMAHLVLMSHKNKSFSLSLYKYSLSLTSTSLARVQIGHSVVRQNAKDFMICMDRLQREFIFEEKAECVCMCGRERERETEKRSESFDLPAISGEPFTRGV